MESINLDGTLLIAGEAPRIVSVIVPNDLDADLFSRQPFTLQDGSRSISYQLIDSTQLTEGPDISQTVVRMSSEEGFGIVSALDDPHPAVVPAVIGAGYLLLCGALEVYNYSRECSGNRRVVIGIDIQGLSFGCTMECTDAFSADQ
ncbi:MAG: hypothetical protein ACLFP0_09030 [Rhodosalinus sp.]